MDRLIQNSCVDCVDESDSTIASRMAPRMTRKITRALQKSGRKVGSELSGGGLPREEGERIGFNSFAE